MNKSEYKSDSPGGQPATSNQNGFLNWLRRAVCCVFEKNLYSLLFIAPLSRGKWHYRVTYKQINKNEHNERYPSRIATFVSNQTCLNWLGRAVCCVFEKNFVFAFVHRTAVTRQMALPSNIQTDKQKRTQRALPQQDSHFCKQSNLFELVGAGCLLCF